VRGLLRSIGPFLNVCLRTAYMMANGTACRASSSMLSFCMVVISFSLLALSPLSPSTTPRAPVGLVQLAGARVVSPADLHRHAAGRVGRRNGRQLTPAHHLRWRRGRPRRGHRCPDAPHLQRLPDQGPSASPSPLSLSTSTPKNYAATVSSHIFSGHYCCTPGYTSPQEMFNIRFVFWYTR